LFFTFEKRFEQESGVALRFFQE